MASDLEESDFEEQSEEFNFDEIDINQLASQVANSFIDCPIKRVFKHEVIATVELISFNALAIITLKPASPLKAEQSITGLDPCFKAKRIKKSLLEMKITPDLLKLDHRKLISFDDPKENTQTYLNLYRNFDVPSESSYRVFSTNIDTRPLRTIKVSTIPLTKKSLSAIANQSELKGFTPYSDIEIFIITQK